MTRLTFPAVLLLGALLGATAPLHAQQAEPQPAPTPTVVQHEQRLGVFSLSGQTFSVVAHQQEITPATNDRYARTISAIEIRDGAGAAAYQQSFSSASANGRFLQTVQVSASILEGGAGGALLLRYLEDPVSTGTGESWQMFGIVNGKLTRYAAPLPLGQAGLAVNGVLTGVMLQGGIGVVPLASQAEAIEFRVWAGQFFVNAPVRVDWPNAQWAEAERCFANDTGSLRQVGCNLRVTTERRAVAPGAAVMLNTQPVDDSYNATRVPVRADSTVDFPAVRALVHWQNDGDRFRCTLDDLWLRVRIDGNEGWVHSAADLAALGLPAPAPAR